jgi:hypothetical protein
MKKRWSPPPKGEAGSGVHIEAAKLDTPEHSHDRSHAQSLYRCADGRESAVGSMVRQSLRRSGGSIVDRRRWPSPCTGEPAGEAVRS